MYAKCIAKSAENEHDLSVRLRNKYVVLAGTSGRLHVIYTIGVQERII